MRRQSDSLEANLCQAQQRDLKTIASANSFDQYYRLLHYRFFALSS